MKATRRYSFSPKTLSIVNLSHFYDLKCAHRPTFVMLEWKLRELFTFVVKKLAYMCSSTEFLVILYNTYTFMFIKYSFY